MDSASQKRDIFHFSKLCKTLQRLSKAHPCIHYAWFSYLQNYLMTRIYLLCFIKILEIRATNLENCCQCSLLVFLTLSLHAWLSSASSLCLLSLFVLCFGGHLGQEKNKKKGRRKRGKTGHSWIKEICETIAYEVTVNYVLIKFPFMF